MKDGPDISKVAAIMGDPARANMMMALMSGMALTSNELAREANVSASTASTHLSRMESCGLVNGRKQGRCKYYSLANSDVAHAVEALVAVASQVGHMRTRPGPRDDKMRRARTCYDHLAGHLAVGMFEHWVATGVLKWRGDEVLLSDHGRAFLHGLGIDVAALQLERRPLCRTCIDWSERKNHLGGGVGAAVFSHLLSKGWGRREGRDRTVRISPPQESAFVAWYKGNGRSRQHVTGASSLQRLANGTNGIRSRRARRGSI
jgi:DNA-binding transcriptional ArsR family regulator